MKLLILTQKVDINDDVLGFFHNWLREFAKYYKQIIVICLEKGEYDLPKNVKILSLGKEDTNQKSKVKTKLLYIFRFYKYIWQERKNYDRVFVHMNPEYIVLGGLFWKLWEKKIGLWYAHGHTPLNLKIAEKITNIIFTSTKSGCRLNSKKIKVVGQGIDINQFSVNNWQLSDDKLRIVTVGRMSPSKDYETLIKAIELLVKDNIKIDVKIIGGPIIKRDESYLEEIENLVREKKLNSVINFLGSVPYTQIPKYLSKADLFVNMSHTGSLDKVMLEAMAIGLPVITCNESMFEVLGRYRKEFMFKKRDFKALSMKIKMVIDFNNTERSKIRKDMKKIVIKNHNLSGLINKIIKEL